MARRPPRNRDTRSQQIAVQGAMHRRRSATPPAAIVTPGDSPPDQPQGGSLLVAPTQPPPQPASVLVAPMSPPPRPQPIPVPETPDHTAQDIAEVRRRQVAPLTPPAEPASAPPGRTHAVAIGVEQAQRVGSRKGARHHDRPGHGSRASRFCCERSGDASTRQRRRRGRSDDRELKRLGGTTLSK